MVEDIKRKNHGGSSSSWLLNIGKCRGNSRNSGSWGKSSSRTRKNVKCWNCQEVRHVKNQCPNPKKELKIASGENVSKDDGKLFSIESNVDSWVMDSRDSFHAMDNGEMMVNLKHGDFGKVRLANDEMIKVTVMRDIDLVTSLGTTWNLRVIPDLKKKLIFVGRLDEQGLEVRFVGGKWRVVNGNMVEVPSEGCLDVSVKHDKIWFSKSTTKRVHFANMKSGAKGMLA